MLVLKGRRSYNVSMPELGEPNKKKKKENAPSKGEVVSAYSEDGKDRQKKEKAKAHALTVVVILLGIALFAVLVFLF